MFLRLVALVLAARVLRVDATANLCSQYLMPSNTTYMQFTKEPVPFEYGIQSRFKSIHCCVKGYRSIEWFKDGVPYPWPAGLSNLILYPEAGNQTLYVRRASRSDSGDYLCRVSNQTDRQEHHVKLQIFTKVTNAPRTMYVSPDTSVEMGASLRLFCEALIERTHLADAVSDLKWKRLHPNGTEGDLLPTQKEINTSREDVPNIFGSYLIVDSMTPQDYGRFVCVIHSNNVAARSYVTVSPPPPAETPWEVCSVPWRGLALTAGFVACVGLAAYVMHRRCTPRLRLFMHQARAFTASPQQVARALEKEFDVLVCWTPVDDEMVRDHLLPGLQDKHKYRVLTVPLPKDPETWDQELGPVYARCRSLLAVVSPSSYTHVELLVGLRKLHDLSLPTVIVLMQNFPDLISEAKEAGEPITQILRSSRIIPWKSIQCRGFWFRLRLALPMPPPPPPSPVSPVHVDKMVEVTAEKASQSGSLTALVV